MTTAVHGLASGHFHPTFADAVLLHIEAFLAVEADADVVFKNSGHMVGATWVDGQVIGQCGAVVAHGVQQAKVVNARIVRDFEVTPWVAFGTHSMGCEGTLAP